jgi:hypothetical protein
VARALNARGLTTPARGRPWTARSVSRVLALTKARPRRRKVKAKLAAFSTDRDGTYAPICR